MQPAVSSTSWLICNLAVLVLMEPPVCVYFAHLFLSGRAAVTEGARLHQPFIAPLQDGEPRKNTHNTHTHFIGWRCVEFVRVYVEQ